MNQIQPHILITGGSGFLGKSIVEELLASTSPIIPSKITVFDTNPFKGIEHEKVTYIKGNVCNQSELNAAFKNVTIVLHTAAVVDWGTKSRNEVLKINVEGTKNVIEACKLNNVKCMVFTSSLDAVFTGKPLNNIDESQPYPNSFHSAYCESKKIGETIVLKAHSNKFKTAIIRPADVYGPADPYHIDSLIEMVKDGFYVRLGNGTSKCQHVFVNNLAYAHLLLAKNLWENNEKVEKQIYFITDGEGSNFFKFFDPIVNASGYKIFPKNLWLPKNIALFLASCIEFCAFIVKPFINYRPKFSRFAVTYTCTNFTFSSKKAEEHFGFLPKYSLEQAIEKTTNYYKKVK